MLHACVPFDVHVYGDANEMTLSRSVRSQKGVGWETPGEDNSLLALRKRRQDTGAVKGASETDKLHKNDFHHAAAVKLHRLTFACWKSTV